MAQDLKLVENSLEIPVGSFGLPFKKSAWETEISLAI